MSGLVQAAGSVDQAAEGSLTTLRRAAAVSGVLQQVAGGCRGVQVRCRNLHTVDWSAGGRWQWTVPGDGGLCTMSSVKPGLLQKNEKLQLREAIIRDS